MEDKEQVLQVFDILAGQKPLFHVKHLMLKQFADNSTEIRNQHRSMLLCWMKWWTRPIHLKKLCKSYSELSSEEWDALPGEHFSKSSLFSLVK